MKAAAILRAGLCVAIASPAMATIWVNEFDNFTGTNGTSVSNYTDTGGGNPNSYTIIVNQAGGITQASPWLSQGLIEGTNNTAKFYNEPGNGAGRARFATLLPTSMDAVGGVAVAWRMRVGAVNPQRGPIQIALTANGNTGAPDSEAVSAFIRLRNTGGANGNSFVDIQRNGGAIYATATAPNTIDTLTLGSNLTDEWHRWTAAVIRRPSDSRAYWKLWLDGNLLLFGGVAGSPVVDPDDGGPLGSQQFSFSTGVVEGFDGLVHNQPYIGLGELQAATVDQWDFEFDYVNFRDDGIEYFVPEPASLILLAAGGCVLMRRRSGATV